MIHAHHLPPHRREEVFYIGVYTSKNSSKGIYWSTLNRRTGKISPPVLAVRSENPSYLAMHPNGRVVYAVQETDHGSVSAYAIGKHNQLRLLNTQPVEGGSPCHLSLDRHGKNLFVASYGVGYVTGFPINRDGSIGAAYSSIRRVGSGPNKDRQSGPHAHWVEMDPHGKTLFMCDLGTDGVDGYRLAKSGNHRSLHSISHSPAEPGDGPRHGAFHPNGRFLYVNGELLNLVNAYRIHHRTGELTRFQSIGTQPEGGFKGNSFTAEIQCDSRGRFLYVSNRGDDSIAVFRIHRNGSLTKVEVKKLSVKIPRGFSIDRSGEWMVVGGQSSNDLASLRIDRRTGKLHEVPGTVPAQIPVCITFRN